MRLVTIDGVYVIMKMWPLIPLCLLALLWCIHGISPVAAEESIVVPRGGSLTLVASLGGDIPPYTPLDGQIIFFYDETNDLLIGNNRTSTDGVATLHWQIPPNYSLGQTLINATFRGNESLALSPSTQRIWITIMANSILDVTVNNSTLAPGDLLILSCQLYDDLGSPISGVPLALSTQHDVVNVITTDENGTGAFTMTCNSSWLQLGANPLEVSFSGVSLLNILPTSSNPEIEMNKVDSDIMLISMDGPEITINSSMTVHLTLMTSDGYSPSASIHVLLDGSEIGTYDVDNSGNMTFHTFWSSNISIGAHILRFSYMGSERYMPSSLDLSFNMTTPLLISIDAPEPLTIDSWGILQVTLSDLIGRPIITGELQVSEGTSPLSIRTSLEQSGENSIVIPTNGTPGIHILTVSVLANPFLQNNSLDYAASFYSVPTIQLLNSSIWGYARPGQPITLTFLVENETSPWSDRLLVYNVSISDTYSSLIDSSGLAEISFNAPLVESIYSINVTTLTTNFEISSSYIYVYIVCQKIPTAVNLVEYSINPALGEIEVHLQIFALNGTALSNVNLYYTWLSVSDSAISDTQGLVHIHLPIPSTSGSFQLHYELKPSSSISAVSGSYNFTIESTDVLAANGVGIAPFATTIILSSLIVLFSIYRKRRSLI